MIRQSKYLFFFSPLGDASYKRVDRGLKQKGNWLNPNPVLQCLTEFPFQTMLRPPLVPLQGRNIIVDQSISSPPVRGTQMNSLKVLQGCFNLVGWCPVDGRLRGGRVH
jgi:hypothetical protein